MKIGYRDMAGISGRRLAVSGEPGNTNGGGLSSSAHDSVLRASNIEQTALAEAVLSVAVEIAVESLGIYRVPATDHQPQTNELPFAILGLGRLGHSGMDYGSDLDLLVVFDDKAPWPPPALVASASEGTLVRFQSPHEFYSDLTSHLVRVLSSITREGLLYRIDLRLRPEGKSGALAQGLSGLTEYLGTRASAWEHSAYLKAREVTGDLEFGARARTAICDACFDAAARNDALGEDLSAMRTRLEKEKAGGSPRDIKWGKGGMTDVYFITRYIQLRDRIYFPTERGTTALIKHLGEVGALDEGSARILFEGYWFLRSLDHWMRLLMDRARPVLPASAAAMGDITRALGMDLVEELERAVAKHTSAIREVYDDIFLEPR
jgi:glutamate-ammonia-ligase adenylyltransferase